MKPVVGKFDPKELEYVDAIGFGGVPIKEFNYPLSRYDHGVAAFGRKPWWQMMQAIDAVMFCPAVVPDNIARALCFEAGERRVFRDREINPDMFGIEWEYVEKVGGSTVRPGKPFLADIAKWRDKIVWPDIDKWDFEDSAARNNGVYLRPENFNQMWFQTGWFERLISFLDFENALLAIFDEDTKEHVHALFDELTDLYIRIFDRVCAVYPDIHAFFIHDDWGSQRAPFFSPDIASEMIVPYMKRLTDFLHGKGKFCEMHSCGSNYIQVPNYIKAGWDAWAPQLMNDCYKIYDEFGDKLLIATFPQNIPDEIMALDTDAARGAAFAALPEEEQRRIAREYADRVCAAGKPSFYNFYALHFMTPAFREELYIRSRENYSG